ncbi:MAG: hypothetical protein AB1756_01140 [Acidobacteriota bacterium]
MPLYYRPSVIKRIRRFLQLRVWCRKCEDWVSIGHFLVFRLKHNIQLE